MTKKKSNIAKMMDGFESVTQFWKNNSINFFQTCIVQLYLFVFILLKYTYRPLRNCLKKPFSATDGLLESTQNTLTPLGTRRKETDGEHYLSEDEVHNFSKTGIHGPFKLLDKSQASKLADFSQKLYESDFNNNTVLGNKILSTLKETKQNTINYTGLFQALYHKDFWDVLCNKKLVQKLSSLLGDNLVCWRSQFFEKKPGSQGTFWHQTGTFRESSEKQKLIPKVKTDLGMVQLTTWIALKDSTIKNGCLRMLEGSFKDSRFERIIYNIIENKIDFLIEQNKRDIKKFLKTMKFTPGNFLKAQILFDQAIKEIPDLFDSFKIIDLTMKAGEAVIFTSLNTHASYPNTTSNDQRLAFAGRFTRSDVSVYKDFDYDVFPTTRGNIKFSLNKIACIPVLGNTDDTINVIAKRPIS